MVLSRLEELLPRKYLNIVSTLSFGWYDVATGITSNQRWNNVVYFKDGIYNIKQCWINVAYFNADMNNVRQRRKKVVIFNVLFYNVETTLWKWPYLKRTKQIISNRIHGIQSFNCYFIIFITFLPMLRGICRSVLVRPWKFFKDHERYCIARTSLCKILVGF